MDETPTSPTPEGATTSRTGPGGAFAAETSPGSPASGEADNVLGSLGRLAHELEAIERRMRLLEIAVRETTTLRRPPAFATTTTPIHAGEVDVISDAASQVTELIRRFVEEVGGLKRDAELAAESSLATARADAELIEREAIKLRDDAEAEASRIVADSRAEARRIREEAGAHVRDAAATAERAIREAETKTDDLVRGLRTSWQVMVDDLQRIQSGLAGTTATLRATAADPRADDVVVVPNAPAGSGSDPS